WKTTSSPNRSSFILGPTPVSPSHTRGKNRMREFRTYGSVRGAPSNGRPYRDPKGRAEANGQHSEDLEQQAKPGGFRVLNNGARLRLKLADARHGGSSRKIGNPRTAAYSPTPSEEYFSFGVLATHWNPTKPPKESLEKLGEKRPRF